MWRVKQTIVRSTAILGESPESSCHFHVFICLMPWLSVLLCCCSRVQETLDKKEMTCNQIPKELRLPNTMSIFSFPAYSPYKADTGGIGTKQGCLHDCSYSRPVGHAWFLTKEHMGDGLPWPPGTAEHLRSNSIGPMVSCVRNATLRGNTQHGALAQASADVTRGAGSAFMWAVGGNTISTALDGVMSEISSPSKFTRWLPILQYPNVETSWKIGLWRV